MIDNDNYTSVQLGEVDLLGALEEIANRHGVTFSPGKDGRSVTYLDIPVGGGTAIRNEVESLMRDMGLDEYLDTYHPSYRGGTIEIKW